MRLWWPNICMTNRKYTLVLDTFLPFPENLVLLPLRYFLSWKFIADYNLNLKLINETGNGELNWQYRFFLRHKVDCWRNFGCNILTGCKSAVVVPLRLQAQQWSSIFFGTIVKLHEFTISFSEAVTEGCMDNLILILERRQRFSGYGRWSMFFPMNGLLQVMVQTH